MKNRIGGWGWGEGMQVNLYPHLTDPNTHGTVPPSAAGVENKVAHWHGRVIRLRTGSRLSIGTAHWLRSAGHFELCSLSNVEDR